MSGGGHYDFTTTTPAIQNTMQTLRTARYTSFKISKLAVFHPYQRYRFIMSQSSSTLSTFQSALETLYGPLALSSLPNPSSWTPPQSSGGHKGRYLWTDAFEVLSLLTLHTEVNRNPATKDAAGYTYLTLASRLVEAVHNTLGYTRDGSRRLSGASDSNPLGGGLRIGKMEEFGSDGDGQYHHYLTLWMFALNRMSVATGDPKYNEQGIALAKAIHGAFFMNRASERARMVWKMDMELNKALVGSEGNLDPIDGFVVFRLLQAAAGARGGDGEVLKEEIEDYARVMRRKGEHFVSADPLDLGMTLWTAHWFVHEEWAAKLGERCFEQICMSSIHSICPAVRR
ncbi:uncharacterized protein APUU_40230A [Aspergillus puulaauensis]|uniref:Uncharacterized protein n=1 Tax=Aspergillus puulaauensis TaxID=1220207 RepID=A0A7R8ALY1_9EURO|nr:uncharacterized protein APUU_40230A [Aspergillus puulaauensis]BCS23786.1 hypothetical protein APUU_40230A [Aspergillus puulaauensis]